MCERRPFRAPVDFRLAVVEISERTRECRMGEAEVRRLLRQLGGETIEPTQKLGMPACGEGRRLLALLGLSFSMLMETARSITPYASASRRRTVSRSSGSSGIRQRPPPRPSRNPQITRLSNRDGPSVRSSVGTLPSGFAAMSAAGSENGSLEISSIRSVRPRSRMNAALPCVGRRGRPIELH